MIKINKEKNIGNVIYIVEGKKDEPRIIRNFYKDFLGYRVFQTNNNDDIKTLKKENNPYNKIIITTINKPQIKELLSDNIDNFYNEVFIKGLNNVIDTYSAAIYYIFDRDNRSNRKEDIIRAIDKYNNSRETNGYDLVHGLILLSYPSIEALYINCCRNEFCFSNGKEIKKYVKENRLNKLCENKFKDGAKEMLRIIKHVFKINLSYSDLDAFENINNKILDKEENHYYRNRNFISLSLFMISLIDLGIITID